MHPRFPPPLVCHVLLIETDNGLVLVDSGHGLLDCDDPARRVGPSRRLFRPRLDHNETALRQVERLGFRREDVRHIVVTHFDMDHIGGISDFPDAQIHVTAAEVVGAMQRPTRHEKFRFRPAQWAYGPKIVEHTPDGERWQGFAAAKELTDIAPGIVLVLHCGDAFYHPGAVDGKSRVPRFIAVMEPLLAFDRKQVRANHARLAELYQRNDPRLFVVCSHDKTLYEQAKATG
jgi:glyoxylase-like metal-dependent hydrolase (beta-lactamase superfamily II)